MNCFLLAQITRGRGLENAQDWFNRTDTAAMKQIALVLCLLGTGVLIAWGVTKLQARYFSTIPAKARPMRLYRTLQRQLELPPSDRWMLWRLAKRLEIKHPAALLISPQIYDVAVRKYCAGSQASAGARFAAIRTRLFPS